MVDALEICTLYDDAFDDEAKVAVYERLLDLDGFESSLSPTELRDRLANEADTVQTLRYRSVHLTMVFQDTTAGLPNLPRLAVHVEDLEFDHPSVSADEREERIDDLVDFVHEWYGRSKAIGHDPVYVFGASPTHVDHLRRDTGFLRTTEEGIRTGELEELYWLQVLPPAMATSIGRERLVSAPAAHVGEFSDGAVLLVAHEDPLEFGGRYLDVLDHFGLGRE